MLLRKKITSLFLLISYLLVVSHQSIAHTHDSDSDTHQHEDFETVHHEHSFHIGIFHFLGHLFKSLNHEHELSDEYLIVGQKTSSKKDVYDGKPIQELFIENSLVIRSIDAESLTDPPFHPFLLHRLKQPNTPLRAPPTAI